MARAPFIIGIGGTARPGSTTERTVACALAHAEALGATTRLFDGPFIASLPLFNPGSAERTQAERDYVDAIRSCDGVIVGTPGYHGSLSGPVKNALDLLEDTAKDAVPYLSNRAFGCIVTAYGWQAVGTTLMTLRSIAHALRAWPTPFGATFNASTPLFEADGSCADPKTDAQIAIVARQVFDFARYQAFLRS